MMTKFRIVMPFILFLIGCTGKTSSNENSNMTSSQQSLSIAPEAASIPQASPTSVASSPPNAGGGALRVCLDGQCKETSQ